MTQQRPIVMLIADDDEEDRMLCQDALDEARLLNEVQFVEDGEQLLDYLNHRGEYADAPPPDLILLDLNMPRMDGRTALKEIKSDPKLRHIPVVVLTTSEAEEDVLRTYDLGCNSFIVKPVSFAALIDVMKTVTSYWFEIVRLPSTEGADETKSASPEQPAAPAAASRDSR